MIEIIPPIAKLSGSVKLPGSKSITNRALLLAALADGESRISGALKSDDTKFMAAALRKLGIKIDEPDDTTFVVFGRNGKLTESSEPLFLGNAGTAVRFLTAAAILVNGKTTIDGDARMRERPIGDLVDALRQLGAKIEYLKKEGCPPLRIISDGKPKTAEEIKVRRDTSSQFFSAILMIWPFTNLKTIVGLKASEEKNLVSPGYVFITAKVMGAFGINTEHEPGENIFTVHNKKYSAQNFEVEADASSATYFLAGEKLLNQKIEIPNLPDRWEQNQNSSQPDTQSFGIIQQFPNLPKEINGIGFPDAIPTLTVLAAFSGREIHFSGIANLRVKECDRIHALTKNLNKIKSGLAEEVGDDLIIFGDTNLARTGNPAEIETFDDHRIAMSFFLAGLKIPGIKIDNPDCVAKSFPNFWKVWESLGVKFLK
ncbi:3-phosphoshikimate 1-carboxyvinyltransferase [Patescibacteria group bacterium]|nr:3-phosphoshikimate 1-carboxyvinyltransferase [Patescibacteria group bacterium]